MERATLREEVERFVAAYRSTRRVARAPSVVHASCNSYLTALRSGSRRRSCGDLRRELRVLRVVAAEALR
jgi:hypothetical protein